MSVLTADPNAVSAGEEPPDTGERRRLTSVTGHRSQPAWDRGLRQGVHRADGRFRRLDLRPHRVGLLRSEPASTVTAAGHASVLADNATTVGALLLLKAFASGCAALTGVEAIANPVPPSGSRA